MNSDPRIADLQRRIRYWLPADAGAASDADDPLAALEADFDALEEGLQALFPDAGGTEEASEALREQAVLNTVLDSMVEGVIVADMEGNVLIFNSAARAMLGQGPENSGPEHWSEEFGLFRGDGKTLFPAEELPLSLSLQGESMDDVELVVRTPNRPGDCHISSSARPLWDRSGTQVGGLVVFHDVTGFKQVERELRRARETAEANDRAKSEFLANMSHEIRTPLTAVLGFSDLLMDSSLGESDRLNYTQAIRRNGEHLLALINDVLDLSKLNAHKLKVETIDCSLPAILHEVASIMQVRALDKGLAFNLSYETPIPKQFRIDPTRVRQILFNLLSNAIKFTPRGEVNIVVRCREAGSDASRVEIDVTDTGIGLKEGEIEALFKPFQQANLSTTREYGGTGLGLTICRSLAEVLGGEIRVSSVPAVGSTFTLVLPGEVATDAPMAHEPCLIADDLRADADQMESTQRLSGRVLLAEDGPDNQLLLSTMLRKRGLEVDIAENGESAVVQALEALDREAPFDIILMDMQMPKLDGYGAAARLRARGYAGPIVALTAHAMTGERERCIAAGCDDYLTKPISRQELLGAVEAHVRGEPSTSTRTEAPRVDDTRVPDGAPIHSSVADDPEMTELVAAFVERLPDQVHALRAAAETGDLERVQRLAHQLKGAAGGYGFLPVSEEAAALEVAAREASSRTELEVALNRFVALSDRVEHQ